MPASQIATTVDEGKQAVAFLTDIPVGNIDGFVVIVAHSGDSFRVVHNACCQKHILSLMGDAVSAVADELADDQAETP